MNKILVIGSTNIDMIACVKHLPRPGGEARFMQSNGGKGANQAVAAARLGGDVAFVSCLGDDAGAAALRQQFAADGINTEALFTAKDTPTGTALIFVSQDGENCIAVAPGANHSLTCEAIDAVADRIAGAEYLLVQLEIPMETVACAIEKAYAAGTRVVLNPAPAMPLADELLRKVYLITPNRTESETLTGIPVHTVQDASKAAGTLLAKGVGNVIVTLGSEGALIRTPAEELLIPARTVTPVDTTAAGDVFNGALLVALSEGRSLAAAVRFGMGTGLYCILGLIGKSFVVDGAIENIRLRKVCTIVTSNPQPILDFIIHNMNRSATVEKAYGAYTHHELSVLVTVLTRRQALQLRNFLRENDPHSFITIVNSSEIIGKGFRSFN